MAFEAAHGSVTHWGILNRSAFVEWSLSYYLRLRVFLRFLCWWKQIMEALYCCGAGSGPRSLGVTSSTPSKLVVSMWGHRAGDCTVSASDHRPEKSASEVNCLWWENGILPPLSPDGCEREAALTVARTFGVAEGGAERRRSHVGKGGGSFCSRARFPSNIHHPIQNTFLHRNACFSIYFIPTFLHFSLLFLY